MKNIHIKKIIYTVLGGMLGLALFITFSNTAIGQNTQTADVVTTAGGVADIVQLQLSREYLDRQGVEENSSALNNSNESAGFRIVGTSMFDDIVSYGRARFDRLAVGYDTEFDFDPYDDTKLMVDGKITIKGLAAAEGTTVPACVNDFGVISECAAGTFSCTNIPANATICPGDNSGLFQDVASSLVAACSVPVDTPYCEYTCNAGYSLSGGVCVADPTPVNGLCNEAVNNGCTTGTLNDIADSGTDHLWECTGSNGGTTDSCSMTIAGPVVNGACGIADGRTFSNPPTVKLCAINGGTASAVTTNAPFNYTWTCNGSGGGTNDSCSAFIGSALDDGWQFVCGTDGGWKLGPSVSSTVPAGNANLSNMNCSGATPPINVDGGMAGGQDFYNPDMRCWDAIPSNCSCFQFPPTMEQRC